MSDSRAPKALTAKQFVERIPGRARWIGEAADPVVAGFLLVVAAAAVVCIALAGHIFHGDAEARGHVIQIVGGIVLLLGAYFTAHHFVVQRAQQRTEMLSKLLDQVASDKPALRIGAIRLMQVLVLELPRTRGTVASTLMLEQAIGDALRVVRAGGCDPATASAIDEALAMPKG